MTKDEFTWIVDEEQFKNYWCLGILNLSTKKITRFELYYDDNGNVINDLVKLRGYLNYIKKSHRLNDIKPIWIGFNIIDYDYPKCHWLIEELLSEDINNKRYILNQNIEFIMSLFYDKTQKLIESFTFKDKRNYNRIGDEKAHFTLKDIFKRCHYNNKAKLTSLKSLEVAMDMPIVDEVGIPFDSFVRFEDLDKIRNYNDNDLYATLEGYNYTTGNTNHPIYEGQDEFALSEQLSEEYQLNLLNANNVAIGESIILKEVSEESGIPLKELRKMRTFRSKINVGKLILDHIDLDYCLEAKVMYDWYDNMVLNIDTFTGKVTNPKNEVSRDLVFKRFKYHFGIGGIHGCCEPNIFLSNDEYILYDIDVEGFYPSLAEIYNIYMEHLGYAYVDAIKKIGQKRKMYAKGTGLNKAMKLARNGSYGKSNDPYSPLCDFAYMVKTTVNGQLMILNLATQIQLQCKSVTMIQANTDGITVYVKRSELPIVKSICEDWEFEHRLKLEYTEYQGFYVRDVNNYIATYPLVEIDKEEFDKKKGWYYNYLYTGTNGKYYKQKVKLKGAYEVVKELHKDNSMRISTIATIEKLVNNIPLEKTIKECNNIYWFCKRLKSDSSWKVEYHHLQDNELKIDILGKVTRYYLFNGVGSLYKRKETQAAIKEKKRDELLKLGFDFDEEDQVKTKTVKQFIGVEADMSVSIFNKAWFTDDFSKYRINYNYYIKEANKLVLAIKQEQLNLF